METVSIHSQSQITTVPRNTAAQTINDVQVDLSQMIKKMAYVNIIWNECQKTTSTRI